MLLQSGSQTDTEEIGRLIGENIFPGAFIALNGELGSGKTALTRGIALGLGIKTGICSPTFTIMHEHEGRQKLYHMDMYRLQDGGASAELWLYESFDGDGVCVVEWPLKEILPESRLEINLEYAGEDCRKLELKAFGNRYEELLEKIAK